MRGPAAKFSALLLAAAALLLLLIARRHLGTLASLERLGVDTTGSALSGPFCSRLRAFSAG